MLWPARPLDFCKGWIYVLAWGKRLKLHLAPNSGQRENYGSIPALYLYRLFTQPLADQMRMQFCNRYLTILISSISFQWQNWSMNSDLNEMVSYWVFLAKTIPILCQSNVLKLKKWSRGLPDSNLVPSLPFVFFLWDNLSVSAFVAAAKEIFWISESCPFLQICGNLNLRFFRVTDL